MVSNYCSSKEKIPKNVLDLAEQISDTVVNGSPLTFHTCVSFSDETYKGTYIIADKNELISDERTKVVDNLTEAFFLLKGQNFKNLVPEVKINIAMSKENSKSPNDVLLF